MGHALAILIGFSFIGVFVICQMTLFIWSLIHCWQRKDITTTQRLMWTVALLFIAPCMFIYPYTVKVATKWRALPGISIGSLVIAISLSFFGASSGAKAQQKKIAQMKKSAYTPSEVRNLYNSCKSEHAPSCDNLAKAYHDGNGVAKSEASAVFYLKKACKMGRQPACVTLEKNRAK